MRFSEPETLERHPGPNSIRPSNTNPSTGHDENDSFAPAPRPAPLVAHGKFRGVPDTRGRRCVYWSCQAQGSAGCNYCRALPYVSSKLRQVSRRAPPEIPRMAADYPYLGSMASLSVDSRLGGLLDELSRLQQDAAESMDSGDSDGDPSRPWALSTLPLTRARERIARLRQRLWTREDLSHMESFFLRRSMRALNRGLFTPRKPASSPNPS